MKVLVKWLLNKSPESPKIIDFCVVVKNSEMVTLFPKSLQPSHFNPSRHNPSPIDGCRYCIVRWLKGTIGCGDIDRQKTPWSRFLLLPPTPFSTIDEVEFIFSRTPFLQHKFLRNVPKCSVTRVYQNFPRCMHVFSKIAPK